METRGQRVCKETFPAMVAKLREASFKPEHCKGRFHGAGLVPYSRDHVLAKIVPVDEAASIAQAEDDESAEKSTITCT